LFGVSELMLFLLFQIGRDRYALDAAQVAVVLPLGRCKKVPGAPDWVEGLFSYGQQHIPVLDISRLALGKPAAALMSTRLVLVHYTPQDQPPQLLGLVMEKATETLRCDASIFTDSGIVNDNARYLGPVMQHHSGLIQRIDIEHLLDESVQQLLFVQEGRV
jgi:chemotaxis-related protein WspB